MNTTTTTPNPTGWSKWRTFGLAFLALFLLGFAPAWAQTVLISPTGSGGFETGGVPTGTPATDFTANGWTVVQGTSNRFFVGTAGGVSAGTYHAFTGPNSTTWSGEAAGTVSHIYQDVFVPSGESILSISLRYKISVVDAGWDFLKVHVVPTSTLPVAGTQLAVGQLGANTDGTTAYTTYTFGGAAPATGTNVRVVISFRSDGVAPHGAAAVDEISVTSAAPSTFTATAQGGLWNSPATWVGGVVPAAGNDIVIPSGSTVAVNQALNYRDLTVNGTLQWATTNTATFSGNVTVGATGNLFLSTSGLVGQTINIAGNLTNNGTINASAASTFINFNGTGNSEINGSGTFVGTGGRGVIRTLGAQNNGTFTLNQTQNITITNQLINTCNNFVTNGRLRVDNAVDVFQSSVSQVITTAMGSGYTTAPVVLGESVSPWVASGSATANTRYYVGSEVYLCTVAGTFDATPPVNTTPVTETNGTATLLWVGNLGNLGNAFRITFVATGTQLYCGDNLYLCTFGGNPSASAPPTHTSGTAVSGTATFAYVGTVAKASVNWDPVTQTVRSLNLVSGGSDYQSIPTITITNTGAGSGAAASSVMFQSAGPANAIATKATASVFTGATDTRHSDAPAGQAGNGVYSATAASYGWYNSPVAIGFTAPPLVNLLTSQGSGYTTAPTVSVTGGTLLSGTALTTASFQVNVADGRVISVYCNTPGTAVYSVPPTITLSGGSGTGASISATWAGAYPSATVNLSNGTNGYITSIDITNNGYGYSTAPTVGFRAIVGGEAPALLPSCRLQQLNLQWGFFFPQTTNPNNNSIMQLVPTNNRINAFVVSSGAQTFTSNIEATALAPLPTFTGVIDMGGSNNLRFSHPDYTGTAGTVSAFVANGSVELSFRGGNTTSATRTFPIGGGTGATAHFVHVTGLGTATTGFTYTGMRVQRFNSPSGTVSPAGNITGIRGVRADLIGTGTLTNLNTARTMQMFWNILDNLVSDNPSIFLADATAPTGPWTIRSTSIGTGALPTTGSRTTATVAPGPYANNTTMYFAWANNGFTPPPALQYNVVRTTGNTYNSIAPVALGGDGTGLATTFSSGDDAISPVISLVDPSNAFTYQGQLVTGFRISTNGNIQLQTAGGATGSTAFSNNLADINILNAIAPFWDDLTANPNSAAGATNNTRYKITGTAPNRTLIVEWANYTVFGAAGPQLFFQVEFVENTGVIKINYGDIQLFNGTNDHRYSYSTGIKGRYNSAYPQAGQVFALTYEASNYWSHVQTQSANLGANALLVSPEPRSSYTFTPGPGYVLPPVPGISVPANDDAASAEPITALSVFPPNIAWNTPDNKPRIYTTRGATTSAQPICGGPSNAKDVWFSFVANETVVTARIYSSGGYIPRVQMLDASLNNIDCQVGAKGGQIDAIGTGLTVGATYYVRVYHNLTGNNAIFTATAVANGNVSGVTINDGGTNYTTSTTSSGGINGARFNVSGGGGNSFVGAVNGVTGGVVTSGTFDGGNDYSSVPTITVESPDWGLTGQFAIVIYAPPINDNCSGAIALTGINTNNCNTGTNQLLGITTNSATPSTEGLGSCTTGADDDLWYTFTATGALTNIRVQGNLGFNPALQIWSGTSCATKTVVSTPAGGCLNATGVDGVEQVLLTTTPGTQYWVRVYHAGTGFGGPGANFDICVTTPVPACASGLSPVVASTICGGSPTTLSWSATEFATSYDVYFDAGTGPATTLVSPAQVGLTYNAGTLAAGDYTYRIVPKNANGDATGCADVTFTVISPTPTSTAPATRCGVGTVTLGATGANLQWWENLTGGVPIGTGPSFTTPVISSTTNYYVSAGVASSGTVTAGSALTTTNASGVTPYTTLWEGARTQYLFRASELISFGMFNGNITALAFDLTAVAGQPLNNFTIKMGHTSNTALTGAYATIIGGLVTVFPAATVTPTVGINTHTFSTPFNWNGTDNIIVEICHDNFGLGFSTSGTVRYTATTFNSTYSEYDDLGGLCPVSGVASFSSNTTNRPNIIFTGQTLCAGPRSTVTATVTPPPALTLDASTLTICEGSTQDIDVTSTVGDFDTYVWSAPAEFTGSAPNFTFNATGASSGVRTLTASQTSGPLCVNIATVNITVDPRPPVGAATATPNPVCEGTPLALNSTGFIPTAGVIASQNFESGIGSWTIVANSTGGSNPALGNFRIVNHGITENFVTYNSPGGTQMLLANSDAQGSGGITNTQLVSPVFSLVGYSSVTISFRHYYNGPTDGPAAIEVSTDGGTTFPNLIADYSAGSDLDQGSATVFVSASFSLNAFIGQPNVRVRFRYEGSWDWQWALDDISISGTVPTNTFTWTSSITGPVGSGRNFTYSAIPITENGATFTVRNTITSSSCFREATVGPVTVNPRPGIVTISEPDGDVYCGAPLKFWATSTGADEYTWGPIAGLYTDLAATIAYPASFNTDTIYLSSPPTATGTYTVTATITATGCFRTANINYTTCPPSANFPCDADAQPLLPVNTLGDVTMTNANNVTAAATFLPLQGISAPPCFGLYNRDVWFRAIVPASGVLVVNVQNNALTPMDLICDVYTSSNNLCTGTFTAVACNDQSGFGNNPWVQVTTLPAGQLVYIRVARKGNGASPVGQFQIGLSEGAVWSGAFNTDMLQQTDDVNGDNNWKFIDNTRLVSVADPIVPVIKSNLVNYPVLNGSLTVRGVTFRRSTPTAFGAATITVGNTGTFNIDRVGASNSGFIKSNLNTSTRGKILGPGITNFLAGAKTYNVEAPIDFGGVVIARAGTTVNSGGNMIFLNNASLLSGNVNRDGFDGTGNVTGNIRYQRSGSSTPGVYNYWSSPVSGAPISVLNNAGLGNNIYLYDNTRSGAATNVLLGWEGPITASSSPTNTSAAMIAGKGYIQTAAGNGSVSFIGAPRQSNVSIPVTISSPNNFNLVGNPYPSTLTLSQAGPNPTQYFFGFNTNVGGVYLWRNDALPPYGGSGYVTMTALGTSGATTPGGYTLPQIGAAQGFMVAVSAATNVNFNGEMRLTGIPGNTPQFLDVNDFASARVRIYNAAETQSYETMIAFKDDATEGIDHQQDAQRFPTPLGLEVYTINGDNQFVIQALPTLHTGRIIPLGTQMAIANAPYKIRLTEFANFDATTRVYIEDLATGAFHNLSANNTYEFVNLPWTGVRFKLHFRAPIAVSANGACAGEATGKLVVNNPNTTPASLTVKNAEGMIIAQENNWMGDKIVNNMTAGNYTINVAYEPTDVITRNAVIEAGSLSGAANFTASAYSVSLDDATVQFTGNNNGATSITWDFGDGRSANGVLNPVHTYSAAGQYTVTLTTMANGCGSSTSRVINVSGSTVGIGSVASQNSFSIYPNPSSDIAYVLLNMAANEKDVMVSIIDNTGRVVSKERVNEVRNGSVITLQVGELANGIYEVVVENKNFRSVGKLSVTR